MGGSPDVVMALAPTADNPSTNRTGLIRARLGAGRGQHILC